MKPAGTVEGDGRFGSSARLPSPTETVGRLGGVAGPSFLRAATDVVPRQNLHVTLAFLGAPAGCGEADAIGAELRAPEPRPEPIVLRALGYRETRSVGMLVFDDQDGAARGARRAICTSGSSGSACTSRSVEPGCRTSPSLRFREQPRLEPPLPGLGRGRSVRSSCLPFPCCGRPGREYVVVRIVAVRRRLKGGSRASTRHGARTDRARVRQGIGHEDERPAAGVRRRRLDRLARARPRARDRRTAARPRRRDLRPGVLGQDDARLPRDRRGAAARRDLRLHRRRARDGPVLREADRREHRRPARLTARHRRAGARDHRAAHPQRRARRRRDRLGRGARRRRPRSRARWATATSASRRG